MERLWVEAVGGVVIARIRGEPTEDLLEACQERVLDLLRRTGCKSVLYDALELDPPPLDVVWKQRQLDESTSPGRRRAILVADARIAYLSRIAFAGDESNTRVFYNDLVAAVNWLRA